MAIALLIDTNIGICNGVIYIHVVDNVLLPKPNQNKIRLIQIPFINETNKIHNCIHITFSIITLQYGQLFQFHVKELFLIKLIVQYSLKNI